MKSKLHTYFYGIINESKQQAASFIYTNECGTSGKSIDDVLSCLVLYLHKYRIIDHERKKVTALYLQCDNTARENKNQYMLGFCQLLVQLGYVSEIFLAMLEVGHTKFAADAHFGRMKQKLRKQDNIFDIPALIKCLTSNSTNHQGFPKYEGIELKRSLKWKEILKENFKPFPNISKMHQFHVTTEGVASKTHCSEKTWSSPVDITKQNVDFLKVLENIELHSFQAVNETVIANIPSFRIAVGDQKSDFWDQIEACDDRALLSSKHDNYGYPVEMCGNLGNYVDEVDELREMFTTLEVNEKRVKDTFIVEPVVSEEFGKDEEEVVKVLASKFSNEEVGSQSKKSFRTFAQIVEGHIELSPRKRKRVNYSAMHEGRE